MVKYITFALAIVLFYSDCFADTFIHRRTGESFNGYAVQRKRANLTQVRTEKKKPQYLDLGNYRIRYNYLGRKNKVVTFFIKDSIDLIAETEAFEKAIVTASNQGPLFILIEIDTPGGKIDLVRRISTAIATLDNCRTVAFVSDGRFGGAFSAGAMIALACDEVYMREGTIIGEAHRVPKTFFGTDTTWQVSGQKVSDSFNSEWLEYCSALAERNDRPVLLVKAMIDKNIQVIEVLEKGKRLLINARNRKPTQSFVRTLSEKGSLLTLTATQAARHNIADKVVASQKQSFKHRDATKARQARNTAMAKARRTLQRGRGIIDRIISSIGRREEQAAGFVAEIDTIEAEIARINKVTFSEREGIPRGYYRSTRTEFELSRLLKERNQLLDRLTDTLRGLIRDYERALREAIKYPDLSTQAETFEKNLQSAQADYETRLREARLRSRTGFRSRARRRY